MGKYIKKVVKFFIITFLMPLSLLWIVLLISMQHTIPQAASEALDNPDRVTLYSIEATPFSSALGPRLNGFPVLGQNELNKNQASEVITSIRAAVPRWRLVIKTTQCFNARQAIGVTSRGREFYFIICYECLKLAVYEDSENLAWLEVSGEPSTLNRILAENGVPLSKSAPQPVHATSPE